MTKQSETHFFALGTQSNITAYGEHAEKAIGLAVSRVWEINDRMSAYHEDSEISQISIKAGISPQKVNPDVFALLQRAVAMSKASGGAFDITVRPLTTLWNFSGGGDFPIEREIRKAKKLVNYRDLILDADEKTAYLSKPKMAIDLGGIAKGYAADEVRRILLENGVRDALINLGGNVVAMGSNPEDGGCWRIGIQNPLSTRGVYASVISVSDKTIVTSAVNEQFFVREGKRYHHLLNPKTGYPADSRLLSVTVIADRSELADALSTSIFVLGIKDGLKLLKKENAEAVFILENGDMFATLQAEAIQ